MWEIVLFFYCLPKLPPFPIFKNEMLPDRCHQEDMSTTMNRQQSKWIAQMLRKDIQSTTWTALPWNPARDKETGRKAKGQLRHATNPGDRQRSWNFDAVLQTTRFKGTWSLFIEQLPLWNNDIHSFIYAFIWTFCIIR